MKQIRILVILVLPFIFSFVYGQEKLKDIIPLKNGKATYMDIVSVDGITKDELYNRAKRWLAYSDETIRLDHKDLLVARGTSSTPRGIMFQTISIQIKDGRYRYTITDFTEKNYGIYNGSSYYLEMPIELYEKAKWCEMIDNQIKVMIVSLEKAMKTPINTNW